MSGKITNVLLQSKKQTGFFLIFSPNKRKEKQKKFIRPKGLVDNNNLDVITGRSLNGFTNSI